MTTPRKRLLLIAVFIAAVMPAALSAWSGPREAMVRLPQSCESPNKTRTLFANEVPNGHGKVGYGTSARNVTVPGPAIVINEGDCLQVDLVNKAESPVGFHTHGVKYTFASDGTPINKGCVEPGELKSFVFSAPAPAPQAGGTMAPGTAGYWHYHDHCMGTPHGSGGIRRGLYGALIVRRAGDPRPDRKPFVVVMNDTTINNRRAPRTPIFKANAGERVEFVVIGHGDNLHTFHLHAHNWFDNRTGTLSASGFDASTPAIDNKTVGPADSFGFQLIAGEGVGPGAWMYHCHVQGHSDGGMSGLFVVRTAGGETTGPTKNAIKRWRRQHAGGHHG